MRIPLKDSEEADLPIIVTSAAKETLVLRAFVRQAIPMLDCPERYPAHERRQLAQTLVAALETGRSAGGDTPSSDGGEARTECQEYEPGCLGETPL
jgi:hypothetical protein